MRTTHGGPSGPPTRPPSKFDAGEFVGWDGEGATEHVASCDGSDGCGCPHRYVYLLNSRGYEVYRPEGISTVDGLKALVDGAWACGPNATHVCYGLSYDANMLVGDLPRSRALALWKGERVRIGRRWKVAYRARKTLWVKDYATGRSVTVWDPFGFYQASFVTAVVKNLGADDPRLAVIREGKRKRSKFKPSDLPFIRRYTGAEVSALVDLMVHLRASVVKSGLKLRRWDGAGALAAAFLERAGVRAHMARSPDEVAEAALYAYAGGRIEDILYGVHDGIIYHADIRSAYPFEATRLPSLKHGHWRRTSSPSEPFAVLKVRWDYSRLGDRRHVLPFPFRSSSSAIYFPRRGVNWAWRPEVDAALARTDLARRTEILDGWEFVPNDPTEKPFAFLKEAWEIRKRMKRAHDAAEKIYKLGPNAVYGKLAQHVGAKKLDDGSVRMPPFHQLEWAGFITSATRARLFDAAERSGDGAICLATDGIYSTRPLSFLRASEDLGGWDLTTHEAMLIAQSGVYFLRDGRKNLDGCDRCGGPVASAPFGAVRCLAGGCAWTNLVEHFRGFDEDTLNPDTVLAAWARKEPSVTATSTRFVTVGRATVSDDAFARWRRWVKEKRHLDVHATGKRLDRVEPSSWTRNRNPARSLMPTDPADPFERESTPYSLAWADEHGAESTQASEAVSLQ